MTPPPLADGDNAASTLVPVLVVLVAVVMTLEILHHLLLARATAVALMGVVWSGFFPRDLQIKAMVAALVYHGAFELVHDWRRSQRASSSVRKARDRKVILSLLFLVRVFIWGAAFAATSSVHVLVTAPPSTSSNNAPPAGSSYVTALLLHYRDTLLRAITTIAALVVYCEAIEVLVLLYFADDDVPYDWRRRTLLWQLSSAIGACEATGLLSLVARVLLARVSPLGLLGVLLAGLWGSIQLPAWHELRASERHPLPHALSTSSSTEEDVEELVDDQYFARTSRELQDDPLLQGSTL